MCKGGRGSVSSEGIGNPAAAGDRKRGRMEFEEMTGGQDAGSAGLRMAKIATTRVVRRETATAAYTV